MPFARLAIALLLTLVSRAGIATNTPCSGKKGGISHCLNQYFVCNDGSTSQSKKDCRTYPGSPGEKPKAPATPKR